MYLWYVVARFRHNALENDFSKVPCILSGKRAPREGPRTEGCVLVTERKTNEVRLDVLRAEYSIAVTALLPLKNTIDGVFYSKV